MMLGCFSGHNLWAQKKLKDFVINHAVQINSGDPLNTDFSDFENIGRAIGEDSIVMIGESEHFDGTTFDLKSRLVKYLHEKKGFSVLVFENDFFNLNLGWNQVLKERDSIIKYTRSNIFPIWSQVKECQDLFENYLPESFKTANPLQLSGFDSQLYGEFTERNLRKTLAAYLKKENMQLIATDEINRYLQTVDSLSPKIFQKYKRFDDYINIHKNDFESFLTTSDQIIKNLGPQKDEDFEYQLIKSLKQYCNQLKNYNSQMTTSINIRDAQMADNFEWLLHHTLKHKKVIVWAANSHILRHKDTLFPSKFLNSMVNMGTLIDNSLNGKAYLIGITSADYADDSKSQKSGNNDFEQWINESWNYAFVDFRNLADEGLDRNTLFKTKLIGHDAAEARWANAFDGILYIKINHKSHSISEADQSR
jgi:erythromycin esterase